LLGALPKSLKRVIFTSSAGVERQGSFPYIILNLFGAVMLPCNRQSGHAATVAANLTLQILCDQRTLQHGNGSMRPPRMVQAC
jgi:hypothetical protein